MNSNAANYTEEDTTPAEGDPVYFYKPNLMGSPWVFHLRPKGLAWEYGRRSGFVAYDRIQHLRMSFRPGTLQMQRFITEIWAEQSPKLQISSVSFRGMMDQSRQDDDYNAFIAELHRRLAAAESTARFESGMNPIIYWLGVGVFAMIGAGLIAFIFRTTLNADWTGVMVLFAVFLLMAWQVGTMLYRNRPLTYRPDSPPPFAMPARSS